MKLQLAGKLQKAFILASIFSTCACGPIYHTDYLYTPPKTEGGIGCIFQCENVKQQCFELEELKAERCEDYSRREVDYCEYDIRIRKDREPKWYECSGQTCSADKERCENSYRACYQSCGGKIEPQTRCVANCNQIPPAQK